MSLHAAITPPKRLRSCSVARRRDDPEVRLMLRVQKDDSSAFRELLEFYWPRIFGRLLRCLHDRQEAEDLAQEVFLRLYRSRKRYEPRAKFGTWLFHTTQNVARNALRSRRRRPVVRLSCLPAAEENGFGQRASSNGSDSPSFRLERSELAGLVRSAVSDLAGRQRTALELHQFHDHSYAEVAEAMSMSPKAAKSLLYRARNQLRLILRKRVSY